MDILSHTCTGLAIGLTVINLTEGSAFQKTLIVLASGLGGAIPDIDAISLWSKFDTVFRLPISGREIYSGKYTFSHHGVMHSLSASIVLGVLFLLPDWIIKKRIESPKKAILKAVGFILAFNFHLLEDMPTPAGSWGGVRYFYPAKAYIGGAGKIWWWNNYDLFLIILSVIGFQTMTLIAKKKWRRRISPLVFFLGIILFSFQINHRKHDYSYTGHTQHFQQFEEWSKSEQKEILGEKVYNIMEAFDRRIPLYF